MSTIATRSSAEERTTLGADTREVARLVLTGTAAGALAGAVVGGLGGRLVMLVLRLTSDPIVLGTTSDDGFEIGRFSVPSDAAARAPNRTTYCRACRR